MGEARLQVDPAEIREQRDRGWPDIHPEDYCHTCGRRNPVWSSPEWVELVGSHAGILCPLCLMGLDPDRMWKVTRQDWPGDDQVKQLAGVLRDVAACDEPERVARCVLDAGWVRANEETDTDEQSDDGTSTKPTTRSTAMGDENPLRVLRTDLDRVRRVALQRPTTDLLSSEQVANIREHADGFEIVETAEYDTELGRTWEANQELGVALVEANAELEVLRGIVARIRDDWKPYEQANGSTPRWVRAGDGGQIEDDPLTPAEVEAIYGKEDGTDG